MIKLSDKHLRALLCVVLSIAFVIAMGSAALADPTEEAEPTYAIGDKTPARDDFITAQEGRPMKQREYTKVAETETLEMFADMQDGYFYLKDRATGEEWHSVPQNLNEDEKTLGLSRTTVRSLMAIEFISREEEVWMSNAQRTDSYAECVLEYDRVLDDGSTEYYRTGSVDVTQITGGIRVEFHFDLLDITIPATFTLKDNYLEASIPNKSGKDKIQDSNKETGYAITSVTLLPAFAAGDWEDQGYLFIPDGSGALVHFNNGRRMTNNYRQPVYGTDKLLVEEKYSTKTEAIQVPVFGTVCTSGENGNVGMMGIITKGDAIADITAITGHEESGYNATSSVFNYRVITKQYNMYNKRQVCKTVDNANGVDAYTVRYYPMVGEKANYIGMADTYRDYLGLTAKTSTPAMHVDLQGFYETDAAFLGVIPYTDQVALTNYEQANAIVDAIKKAGINNLALTYSGWQNNGIDNKRIPTKAVAASVLGGEKGFDALVSALKSKDVSMALAVDLLSFTEGGNGIRPNRDAIRTAFDKIVEQPEYILSNYITKLDCRMVMYLSPSKIEEVAKTYLASLKEQGIKSVNLGNYGNVCYSNYHTDDTQHRTQFVDAIVASLKAYKEAGISVTVDGGFAYVLPYVDAITDVPTCSSGYDIFDEDVPFFQAVVHGYLPYSTKSLGQSANQGAAYLTAVEGGTQISYAGIYAEAGELFDTDYNNLYSSTYSMWLRSDKAVAQYNKYMPLLEKINAMPITAHYQAAHKVYVTEYSDGKTTVKVAVNYTKGEVTVDGMTVPAESFEYVEVSE